MKQLAILFITLFCTFHLLGQVENVEDNQDSKYQKKEKVEKDYKTPSRITRKIVEIRLNVIKKRIQKHNFKTFLSSNKLAQQDSLDIPFASYTFNNGSTKNIADTLYHGKKHRVIDTTDRFGNAKSAMYFDGKAYISLGDNFHHLNDEKPYSISLWFKTKKSGALITRYNQVSKHTKEIDEEFVTCVNRNKAEFERSSRPITINENNKVRFNKAKRIDEKEKFKKFQSKKRVRDNKWHQMVVIYDGKISYLYLDGKLQRKTWYMAGSSYTVTPVIIGNGYCYGKLKGDGDSNRTVDKRNNVKYNYKAFKGFIDDVKIYNKAISLDTIQKEYSEYKVQKKK